MNTRYALIGGGMMGREHIGNVALLDNVDIVALVEPDAHERQHTLACLNAPVPCHDTLEELPAEGLDALVIASPNHCHKSALDDIVRRFQIPVLIEKPLCTTLEDCHQLIRSGHDYPAAIWVAMEYRYMSPVAHLIERVHQGDVGDLRMLSIREHRFPFLEKVGNWNRFNQNTGGTLVEKCCHFFDLMRLIFRDEPTRMYASGGHDVNHKTEHYPQGKPDILDNALVIVDFPGNRRALLELCMFAEATPYQEVICAIGDQARLEAFVPGPQRFWPGALQNPEAAPQPYTTLGKRADKSIETTHFHVPTDVLHAGDHQGATFYQHQRFLECVRTPGLSPAVTILDGARAVAMGLCAEESVRSGQITHMPKLG